MMLSDSPSESRSEDPPMIKSKFIRSLDSKPAEDSDESELEASIESPEASAESFEEVQVINSVARNGGIKISAHHGGFTAPRSQSSWKENDQPSKTSSQPGSSSGWNFAKPRAAPAGPPPASMADALKKSAPSGPPPASLRAAAEIPPLATDVLETGGSSKPYSIAEESDMEELEAERDANGEERSMGGENDDEDVGDDVIRHPIVRDSPPRSPFSSYASEKRESGITLARKSGYYDEEDLPPSPSRGVKVTTAVSPFPFVLVAHERGSRTEHVQCTIYRDRSTAHTMLYPEYQLVADDTKRPLLLARKMSMNRTSNYHVWDLTRGVVGAKLTKKSGNYLGKLRALNSARTEYVIVTSAASGREELGGIVFERLTIFDQLKAGSQPRKMMVLVPALDTNSIPVPTRPAQGDEPIAALLKSPQQGNSSGMFVLESKMPSFENGNYRLNFRGRVNLPSVKNFQLVSPADVGEIICQFGKVNDDKFHLDFKAPLNAVQAFCLSLTQFNL